MRALFGRLAFLDSLDALDERGVQGDPGDDTSRESYRAIFISDRHLGTAGCQAEALLDFMRTHPSRYLYLVGDIVDGWQLRRRWFWPQSHNDVVQKLLRRARKGCRVIYLPGNHDEFARGFIGHQFGGIEVVQDAIHRTADGRRLWVIHGDYFDGVIQHAKGLAYTGDNLYECTLKLNRHRNNFRARLGLPYWSLSAYLKHKVKMALNYATAFEEAVAQEARNRGHHGVVCAISTGLKCARLAAPCTAMTATGWTRRTALVEHHDGRLELIAWSPSPAVVGSVQELAMVGVRTALVDY